MVALCVLTNRHKTSEHSSMASSEPGAVELQDSESSSSNSANSEALDSEGISTSTKLEATAVEPEVTDDKSGTKSRKKSPAEKETPLQVTSDIEGLGMIMNEGLPQKVVP